MSFLDFWFLLFSLMLGIQEELEVGEMCESSLLLGDSFNEFVGIFQSACRKISFSV